MPNASSGRLYAFLIEGARQDTGDGLWTLDVTDPTDPVPVDYAQRGLTTALDVAVAGDYAYVAGGEAGLAVVDVSEPTAPAYAFLADTEWGLCILDISDPAHPVEVWSPVTAEHALGVTLAGDPTIDSRPAYVYVGGGESSGLRIFDVSNPHMPVEIGRLRSHLHKSGYTEEAAVAGHYAYIADGGGLVTADVSNPAWPRDLYLVNVTDPCAPTQAGILETPGGARNVVVVEDTAYVAADRNGLLILRLLWDDQ